MTACRWDVSLLASHDVFRLYGVAIYLFACLVIRTKRGALQGKSGKYTTRTRIAEDLCSHPSVCICGSITAFGTACNGSICTQLNLTAENRLHSFVIHD